MSGLSSVYPPAPLYYKHFTKENLEKLKELQEKPGYDEDKLEAPLSHLVPPKPPAEKSYRSFGNVWQPEDKLQSLDEAGITQLYKSIESPTDRIRELKTLLRSLLANYLELTGIMSIHPEKFPAKVEDIRVILINVHHLLNEYRPHQSRENLIMLMDNQIKQKRGEIEMLKQKNTDIYDKIRSLANTFELASTSASSSKESKDENEDGTSDESQPRQQLQNQDEETVHKHEDLAMWKALEGHL